MINSIKKLTIIAAYLFASITGKSQEIKFLTSSYEDALANAKERNVPVFIDWYADWCVPCKIMDKEVYVDTKLGSYFNQHFVSVKLNTEAKENLELVKKLEINSMPTLMFVDVKGTVISRISGSMGVEDLLKYGKTVAGDLKSFEELYNDYQKKPGDFKITEELLAAAPAFVTAQNGMDKKKWVVRVEKIFNDYVEKKLTMGDELINTNDYKIIKRFHQPKEQNDPVIEFMIKNMDKYLAKVGDAAAFYVIEYNNQRAEELAKKGNKNYTVNLDRINGDMRTAYNVVKNHKLSQYEIARLNCEALYALYEEKNPEKFIRLKNEYFIGDDNSVSPLAKASAAQIMYSVASKNVSKENDLVAKEWIISSLAAPEIPAAQRVNILVLLGDVNKKLGNLTEAQKSYNQAYAETLQISQEQTQKYLQLQIKRKIELLKLE